MAKGAPRFGCAKQSKNLKSYLMNTYDEKYQPKFILPPEQNYFLGYFLVIIHIINSKMLNKPRQKLGFEKSKC